ncbi:MAG: ATP-dependent zinc metalloprotease FtsH [Clostridia bacterium]|nr:ATP-dependent zinc metalloprotease FtsH [Clostridia bacterium]
MNKRSSSNAKTLLLYLVVVVVLILVLSSIFSGGAQKNLGYSDIRKQFTDANVEQFTVTNDNIIILTLKEPLNNAKEISYELKDIEFFREDLGELINKQLDEGILTYCEYEPDTSWPWWVVLLPYAAILILFAVIWIYVANQASGKGGKMNSFGRARVKTAADNKQKVTFKDVAGADEEKEELKEIVDFLKDPQKYTALGAKIPHGVLLMGPPGTGKTLLAKAVAGEADVPFLSISGSDFVEMYVGVGASRVRDLFETARKSTASIVFIDEIDAVGRHRGAGLGGGHDEREQTLNQLLVEMDGFGAHEGIIVMAATNRPDILDPALLRPGRFDRQITVNYPDIKGREEILLVHARNKKFEDEVDFATIAKTTSGFTGADLANLLNEAALLAVRRGKSLIGMDDIEDAFIKVLAGPQKKSRRMIEKERKNTAYHEAGHAVVGYYLPTQDPVHAISIIPAGQTLGVTISIPTVDKFSVYKQELNERISGLLGGRVAEQLTFGDYSGGASNDIQRATGIAHKMVTQLGMSDLLGPIRYGSTHGDDVFLGRDFSSQQDYSDATAAKIDTEVQRIVTEAYDAAKKILTDHADKLKFVAEFLLSHEMMDGDQFRAAMESDSPSTEELEAIAAEKKRRSKEANENASKNADTVEFTANNNENQENQNDNN